MRAVNLIPLEARRGSDATGKSGGAVYVLLGVLGALVVFAGVFALSQRQIAEGRAETSKLEQEAMAAEARVQQLTPYREFSEMARTRAATVKGLAEGRVDWAFTLHEVSRVVPAEVSLTSLTATAAPGVDVQGGGSTGSQRQALPNPAVEIQGCTPGHADVALLLSRLRAIDGVQRVALGSSEKVDTDLSQAPVSGAKLSGADSAAVSGDDCRQGDDDRAQFNAVVFLRPNAGAAAATGGAAGRPAATGAPATPPASGSPQPAGTGTSPTPAPAPTPAAAAPTGAAK